ARGTTGQARRRNRRAYQAETLTPFSEAVRLLRKWAAPPTKKINGITCDTQVTAKPPSAVRTLLASSVPVPSSTARTGSHQCCRTTSTMTRSRTTSRKRSRPTAGPLVGGGSAGTVVVVAFIGRSVSCRTAPARPFRAQVRPRRSRYRQKCGGWRRLLLASDALWNRRYGRTRSGLHGSGDTRAPFGCKTTEGGAGTTENRPKKSEGEGARLWWFLVVLRLGRGGQCTLVGGGPVLLHEHLLDPVLDGKPLQEVVDLFVCEPDRLFIRLLWGERLQIRGGHLVHKIVIGPQFGGDSTHTALGQSGER